MPDYIFDSFEFVVDGVKFRADLVADECASAPWENSDCYGEVSDWLHREKRPCERVLSQDRGFKRFYDHASSVRKFAGQGCTAKQAHEQALSDYERLLAWYSNERFYCGVVVTLLDDFGDEISDVSNSFWGIESDANAYHKEVANGLASELLLGLVRGEACHV